MCIYSIYTYIYIYIFKATCGVWLSTHTCVYIYIYIHIIHCIYYTIYSTGYIYIYAYAYHITHKETDGCVCKTEFFRNSCCINPRHRYRLEHEMTTVKVVLWEISIWLMPTCVVLRRFYIWEVTNTLVSA